MNNDKTCLFSFLWGFVICLPTFNVMDVVDKSCDKEHVHHGNKLSCLNDR